MKSLSLALVTVLLFLSATMSSCQAIGDIFKAGVWVGVIGVAIVVFLIIYFIGKSKS
jgi:hypothetical protein